MIPRDEQARLVARVAEEAAKRGLVIAPIGSTYFLATGTARATTKDVDVAVHDAEGEIAALEDVSALGNALRSPEVAHDRASVVVTVTTHAGPVEIELIRGREAVRKGYVARGLLRAAWRHARKDGNVYWYPIEFVLVLKADAAIDREERAARGGNDAEANRRRAAIFRGDVFQQVRAASPRSLSAEWLVEAIAFTKKGRRGRIAALIEAASGGTLSLDVGP